MAKSYRWGSRDPPKISSRNYGPWQTRTQMLKREQANQPTFRKQFTQPTITNDLARAIQFEHIPRDVIARIHVHNVAQAIVRNKKIINNTNVISWAQKYISTSSEAQLANGMELAHRGRPVYLAEGHLENANIHSYSGFINAAKRALKTALLQAGENAQKKFNYSELIDFASKGQKRVFHEGLNSLFRNITLATDSKVMRSPEQMLERDATLLQTKQELKNLIDKIARERRTTQLLELKKSTHKVNLINYANIFNLMEQYEELAKKDIFIGEQEKKLLSEWRELKAKMAFSEVETK